MYCKVDECDNPIENHELGLCGSHSRKMRKEPSKPKPRNPIRKVSHKKGKEISEYSKVKKEFFSNPVNRICHVCKLPGADTIHHSKGRNGYADQWAKEKGITLLIDSRFFVPIHSFNVHPEYGCSCHDHVEKNPEWAMSKGLTLTRQDILS